MLCAKQSMVYIVGIAGKKLSGKSTFVEFYIHSHKHQSIYVRAFADPLKEACKSLFIFDNEQLVDQTQKEAIDNRWKLSPRQIMQWLGTDVMRQQFRSDFWIYNWLLWYKTKKWEDDDIIFIPDVRFQNEIDFIHNTLNGKIILINRIGHTINDEHLSENNKLDKIDIEIENTTLDKLKSYATNYVIE